ncbi:hypothetical protein QBC40DRAFT_25733 [Triangularia verruculosa]|uniref:ubiquitinyl hydrolase 1 n=1 Tax=Triangularia verruculosa TaxID=2587418 RepID=A0AAN6X6H7_9PEZI|nr:hypothetical protein QBC40DRAFT_25733 [Triangularia verruculosa]
MGPKRGARGGKRGARGGNTRGNRGRGKNSSSISPRQVLPREDSERPGEIPDSIELGSAPEIPISIGDDTPSPRQTRKAKENDQNGSIPEDSISVGDDTSNLRRSSRARKTPTRFDQIPAPSRTPKRKASPADDESEPESELEDPELPEYVANDIIAASLEPWKPNELEQWDGWAEVVSSPAVFTDIMRKLGVRDAWIEDALVLENLSSMFSQPVHGLVFLQKYSSMHKILLPNQPDKSAVWFAQQTATNACGTIAIINILMNAKDAALGDKLSEFKEASKDLSSAWRGNMIATSPFIRCAHSFHNTRIDLLTAARELETVATRNKRYRALKAARNAKRTASGGQRQSGGATSFNYHFVAIVPIGNGIWLLDGLETEPGYICDIEHPDNWLKDIESTLEAYVAEKEGTEYSLMALCGGPQGGGAFGQEANIQPNEFSLAIHEWVKRLAECGKLQEIVRD